MRTTPRLVGAACAAALLVSACSSSQADPEPDETTTGPTASAEPSSEATSTSEDPFAMPDPVTEEYVDRVVNTLYEEWGAIFIELAQEPADPTAVASTKTQEAIAALFSGDYLRERFEEANDTLRGNREGLLPPDEFDQLRISTVDVKAATRNCILAVADYDRSGTTSAGTIEPAAFVLRPGAENRTGWTIDALSLARDGEGKQLPAEVFLDASSRDLAEFLGSDCTGDAT